MKPISSFSYRIILCTLLMTCLVAANPSALYAETSRNETDLPGIVYLGFPQKHWKRESTDLNLSLENSFGSAFLKQLRRQALLVAARDELGLRTRDLFLQESLPGEDGGAVEITDIETFPSADPEYVDHRQFVAELERRSREVFPGELIKLGARKVSPVKPEGEAAPGEAAIKLLHEYALIPQFDAVRRLHAEIREKGETLPRLAALVRAYSQLQLLTNYAPRDSHRVFQARAILYAQRAVARFGETPETLSLRAAAWSLNNFPRIAREEFAAADPEKSVSQAWIDFARYYAAFDFQGLDKAMEAYAENKAELPLAKLLRFLMLVDTRNGVALARPYGETILADLPDCGRLYQSMFAITTFDIPQTPDGENFIRHLDRRLPNLLRDVHGLAEPVSKANRTLREIVNPPLNLSVFEMLAPGGGSSKRNFSQEEFYQKLGDLFEAMSQADVNHDRDEPSLQALGSLLLDEEFFTVLLMTRYLSGHNGSPESIFTLSRPALKSHPLADHLGVTARDETFAAQWQEKITGTQMPYEMLSQVFDGFGKIDAAWIKANLVRAHALACRFADRENTRDMLWYHQRAAARSKTGPPLFSVERLMVLCPENPFVVSERLSHHWTFDAAEAEKLLEKFEAYPNFREAMTNLYRKNNQETDALGLMRLDFRENPRIGLATELAIHYMKHDQPDRAIETLKFFLDSPNADVALDRAWAMLRIGMILHENGRSGEARPYFNYAAGTHSAWGLINTARYMETVGEYDTAEKMIRAYDQSYRNKPLSLWWGACYRMSRENLEAATKACEEAAKKNPNDKSVNLPYIYYCLGRSTEELYAKDYSARAFLEDDGSILGVIDYCEALENGDNRWAEAALKILRDENERVNDEDLKYLARESGARTERRRSGMPVAYKVIAAMIEADRLDGEPGNLNQDEIEYLLSQNYTHAFENGRIVWLLYVFGRYYEACGKVEKAKDCYRRVLAMRMNNDLFPRCFAVKELRKFGTTDEEILRLTATEPGLPRRQVSMKMQDLLARQLFRDYTDSPSTTMLQTKPENDSKQSFADFGKPRDRSPGLYRTTEILFRGRSFMKPDTSVHWHFPKDADWRTTGTAMAGALNSDRKPPRPDGLQPLTLGENRAVPALAGYFGDKVVLVLSLDPNAAPDNLQPEADSPFVRIEMEKMK